MYRVVDTEAHTEHDVDAGDDVDGDVPEVEEADDVGQASGDIIIIIIIIINIT